MAKLEIKCINKEDRYNPREKITHVGGKNSDGSPWKFTQKEAIQYIENGTYSFYVEVDGDYVDVEVAESQYGNKYIKTKNDGDEPNNLLELPECP